MVETLNRLNSAISLVLLSVCCIVFLIFGWSISGWKSMAIPTGSMKPAIQPGSMVLVHRVPISSLKIGDVIIHIDPGNPKITISHRIVKEYKLDGSIPMFVTKGDANKFADVPVSGSEVVGKVIWAVPNVGWAMLDAKKPWVILPLVYIAGLLIMFEEVIRLRDYWKQCIPYRAPGFKGHDKESSLVARRTSQGVALTAAFVAVGIFVTPSALAAIRGNSVSVAPNRITVAAANKSNQCTGNNHNTVTINNNTTQSGSSGNVFVGGNKGSSGSISSGNVSNNNTTTTTVNQGC